MTAIIVAYDTNLAIGKHGDLPWGRALLGDLAHFRKLTRGGSIIMGRRTFESIGKKPLPERENIVISSRPTGVQKVLTAMDLESALALARYPALIIGGAQVYAAALKHPDIDTIYATEVQASFPDADTFFPQIDTAVWREVDRQHHPKDEKNRYDFDIVTYARI